MQVSAKLTRKKLTSSAQAFASLGLALVASPACVASLSTKESVPTSSQNADQALAEPNSRTPEGPLAGALTGTLVGKKPDLSYGCFAVGERGEVELTHQFKDGGWSHAIVANQKLLIALSNVDPCAHLTDENGTDNASTFALLVQSVDANGNYAADAPRSGSYAVTAASPTLFRSFADESRPAGDSFDQNTIVTNQAVLAQAGYSPPRSTYFGLMVAEMFYVPDPPDGSPYIGSYSGTLTLDDDPATTSRLRGSLNIDMHAYLLSKTNDAATDLGSQGVLQGNFVLNACPEMTKQIAHPLGD